jgi:hypothetical protein
LLTDSHPCSIYVMRFIFVCFIGSLLTGCTDNRDRSTDDKNSISTTTPEVSHTFAIFSSAIPNTAESKTVADATARTPTAKNRTDFALTDRLRRVIPLGPSAVSTMTGMPTTELTTTPAPVSERRRRIVPISQGDAVESRPNPPETRFIPTPSTSRNAVFAQRVRERITSEFFSVFIASVVGNSSTALFSTHPESGYERISGCASRLDDFRTLGQIFAFSVITGNPTGLPLPATFFRHLLGQSVSLDEVQVYDREWVNGARGFLNIETQDELDAVLCGDPLPGSGSNEALTLENRDEMMQRAIENFITNNSPTQFAAIAEGFFGVLPRDLFVGVSGEDLAAIIVGNLDVSSAGLRERIVFDSSVPQNQRDWLFNIINGFTALERREFLRFVTGFSFLPVTGSSLWVGMRVSGVPRMKNGRIAWPCSELEFRSLSLPLYESEEEMRGALRQIFELESEGGIPE